jgi:hypothetical protein
MKQPAELLIVCHATCFAYCDKSREENGDYITVARLFFSDLKLEINKPRSTLLPEIRKHAEKMQAKQGQPYPVSSSGQTITLGYALQGNR